MKSRGKVRQMMQEQQEIDVAANLSAIRERIDATANGRSVRLVAVSKFHGPERILPALGAGQRHFGENWVQEAAEKWPPLRRIHSDIVLHLIGPLQSNKTADAVALFDVIETVDREKIARRLAAEMQKQNRRPECFVQVNIGEEPQKAGIPPREADDFIRLCRDDYGLPVTGLMCIPPVDEEPSPFFALLAKIARRNGLENISMGMSADFEVAIAFGATEVRIGSDIFGPRPVP